MDTLKLSIQKTLAYMDLFACPLTKEELYTYLFEPEEKIPFDTFSRRLETLQESKDKKFETSGGYYFLQGRSEIVAMRERRVWYIEKKIHIATRAAELLKFIPFVEAFFVCNQIQIGVSEKSDIDVLIVVKQGRLFCTRLMVTLLLGIFRLRRGKKKVTDRICLSFYVTNNALNFSSLKMGDRDIYFLYWLSTLIPIYDPQNFFAQLHIQNSWVRTALPHIPESVILSDKWKINNSPLSVCVKQLKEKILSKKVGDTFEKMAKKIQLKHMQANTNSVQNQDSRVVISDTLLKFHENDRRELFRQEWEKRWKV